MKKAKDSLKFVAKHTECRRFEDCWAIFCVNSKGEMSDRASYYYATLRGAVHKMVELELAYADDEQAVELRDAAASVDAAYQRVEEAISRIYAEHPDIEIPRKEIVPDD